MAHKVIDAHTHIFPRDIPEKWDWYAEQDVWFRYLTEQSPKTRVREAWSTPEETLKEADRAGVDVIVMQGWYWNSLDLCKRHNDFMADTIRKYPDRFVAYGSINPKFGEESVKEVERCYEMGFSGLGELGPGGNGFALDDPGLYDVLGKASELHLPVNFHCGEPVGHVYPGKDLTPIAGFVTIAEQFPELKLVLAHAGGGLCYYELMPEMKKVLKNAYYDLAANPLLYDIRSIRLITDIVGAEKVLFGTDFPLTIYPWITKERNLSLFKEDVIKNGNLTEEELPLILGDNMEKLIANAGKKFKDESLW